MNLSNDTIFTITGLITGYFGVAVSSPAHHYLSRMPMIHHDMLANSKSLIPEQEKLSVFLLILKLYTLMIMMK